MDTLLTILQSAAQIPEKLKALGKAEMADTVLNVTQGAYDQMSENLSLKEELNNIKGKLRNIEDELKKLKDIQLLRSQMRYEHDCYWDDKGHPICSACLEKPIDPAPIRMHTDGRDDGFASCPICKSHSWSKGKVRTQFTKCDNSNW